MNPPAIRRIQKAFERATEITIGNLSRIVIISDCHRGSGDNTDNFARNKNIYHSALYHYYKDGFTCIELGDGDELWENRNFSDITEAHQDTFNLLARFHEQKRLFMVYGNHDIVKRNKRWVKDNMFVCYDERKKQFTTLFPDIKVHESIVLKHKQNNSKIFLVHGHQADFFNDTLYPLSRFLVRYLWRPLEAVGVTDPTSASKNKGKKHYIEENLMRWAKENNTMLIAGHTHRSMFPQPGEPAYFNDGSCVRAGMISVIEIQHGMIYLVKWGVKVRKDNILFVAREIMDGPEPLEKYLITS